MVEIGRRIAMAQVEWIDAVKLAHIVVAHVLEVPADIAVARHAALPVRVVAGSAFGAGQATCLRYVGKGEAFAGKAHIGAACVLQRPAIGADAVVVGNSLVRRERHGAARRRIGDIGDVGADAAGGARQDFLGQRRAPALLRQAHHRALLVHLAAPADDGKRGRGLRPCEQVLRFPCHRRGEGRIGDRIVEIGEGKILPDENAGFVAQLKKGRRFRRHRAADPQHVHVGVAGKPHPRLIGRTVAGKGDDVGAGPDRPPAEHRHAIDDQSEPLAVRAAFDLDPAEAGACQTDMPVVEGETDLVQMRRAVRVRPPCLDARQQQFGGKPSLTGFLHRRVPAGAGDRGGGLAGAGGEARSGAEGDGKPPGAVIGQAAFDTQVLDHDPVFRHESHLAPGADRMHVRAPAGHVAEQRRAHHSQAGFAGQFRAPAGARPLAGKMRAERAEAEDKLGRPVDVEADLVARIHAVRNENRHAVEPGLADGGKTRAGKHMGTGGARFDPAAVPDVAVMQRDRCVTRKPSRRLQRRRPCRARWRGASRQPPPLRKGPAMRRTASPSSATARGEEGWRRARSRKG